MTVVLWIAAGMLSVAGLLALVRIARGPSSLDRVVALDVLLSCLIAGIGLEAAYNEHGLTLPVLAVLALLGFVGAVTVARFGADSESDDEPEPLVRDEEIGR
ncbi:MAG: monovalent cation/H+ antiporter complex subunit F [Patulibacter sp.]